MYKFEVAILVLISFPFARSHPGAQLILDKDESLFKSNISGRDGE